MLYLESRSDAQRQQRTRQRLLRDVRAADSLGACIDALGPPSCTRELSMSCLVCTLLRVSDPPRCLPCASPAVFNCFHHARAPWHGQAQTHAPTPRHCHGRPQSIAVPVRHWVRAWSACAHTTCVRAPPPPHNGAHSPALYEGTQGPRRDKAISLQLRTPRGLASSPHAPCPAT